MTNKMRTAINSLMSQYDLSDIDVLHLVAAGAETKRKQALNDIMAATERKMKFVRDHAIDWIDFMEGHNDN